MAEVELTCLAVDLGATNTRVALVDQSGRIIKKDTCPTPKTGTNDKLISSIKSLISRVANIEEIKNLSGLGVCVPGSIDQSRGVLINPPNLPYKNVAIVSSLASLFKTKVVLNNDANAAAIGEKHWGQAKNTADFAYLTISSGIGGAVYQENKLKSDKYGNSIEIGHTEIKSEFDLSCGCGKRNHWEAYASGNNMANFLSVWLTKNQLKADFDGSNVYTILAAVENKNEVATNFFEQLMAININGINYLIKKFEPELIIIGGSVYLKHQPLFNRYLGIYPFIKAAFFGDDASLVGTAASVFIL